MESHRLPESPRLHPRSVGGSERQLHQGAHGSAHKNAAGRRHDHQRGLSAPLTAAGGAACVSSPAYPGIRHHDSPGGGRLCDRWRPGEQRDIAIDMMHLALNVVAQTLFATDLREEVNELADAINRIMGLYNFLVMLPAAEWLVQLRPPGLAAFVKARQRVDAVVYRMIAAHRLRDSGGGSLLDLMLAASPDKTAASEQ